MSGFSNFIPAALTLAGDFTQADDTDDGARAHQVALQNDIIEADRQTQAAERRDLLARQRATERARMAAWGVGADGGSSAALLTGLSRRGEADLAALDRSAALRSARNRASLLEEEDRSAAGALDLARDGYKVFSSFYDWGR